MTLYTINGRLVPDKYDIQICLGKAFDRISLRYGCLTLLMLYFDTRDDSMSVEFSAFHSDNYPASEQLITELLVVKQDLLEFKIARAVQNE